MQLRLPLKCEELIENNLWVAIIKVGPLSEQGSGNNKKTARNEACFKMLKRCLAFENEETGFVKKISTQAK